MALSSLIAYFLKKIVVSRIGLFLTPILSTFLALLIMPYGLSLAGEGEIIRRLISTGWTVYSVVLTGTIMSIFVIIDMTTDQMHYWKSLPVPPSKFILARFLSSGLAALPLPIASLTLTSLLYVRMDFLHTSFCIGYRLRIFRGDRLCPFHLIVLKRCLKAFRNHLDDDSVSPLLKPYLLPHGILSRSFKAYIKRKPPCPYYRIGAKPKH